MTNFAHYPESDIHLNLHSASWWQRQGIRFKTTILAIAFGTIPTLIVGSVAYHLANNSVTQETTNLNKTLVSNLQNQVNVFVGERLHDLQVIASLDIFTNPQLRQTMTRAEETAALQKIQAADGVYDQITLLDLQGKAIAQTTGTGKEQDLNQQDLQAALKSQIPVFSQTLVSNSDSGVFSIYGTAPIKDSLSGKTIALVQVRIPVTALGKLLENFPRPGSQYYLLNQQGQIWLDSTGVDREQQQSKITPQAIFPDAEKLFISPNLNSSIAFNTQTNAQQLLVYAPGKVTVGQSQLKLPAILATDTDIIYATQAKLRLVFALGSISAALGVGAIAYYLANRLLNPILQAAQAVQEIGQGRYNTTRLEIKGTDELAQLGSDINRLAAQLNDFVQAQSLIIQQSENIQNISLELTQAQNWQEICAAVVPGVFHTFNPERVVYFQFDSESAIAVAESVAQGHKLIQNSDLSSELAKEYLAPEYSPQIEVIEDLTQANVTSAKKTYLESLNVKSCLIAPVMSENQLQGLLMVHQSSVLQWMNEHVRFLQQVSSQIVLATNRLKLGEQQKIAQNNEKLAKEAILARALSLLAEVDNVSKGDLTIRARVTEDEIGTIADAYNATIENLQILVNQTKTAVAQVQSNTSSNNSAVESLAQEAIAQAQSISRILEQIKGMETSISLIAHQANKAEAFVHQATITIEREDQAMNLTVAEIKAVQHTVTQTAAKAEKLGASSQEISQAVNLISRFASQTHLLALKASIEAARAGEQGKGFAVIADEVRSLATQSAEATAEIETLVSKIQLETTEVVQAMHRGAAQIASGNELVQQTRQSLSQVNQISGEINKLVISITQASQQQSNTSVQVSQAIVAVAANAEHNSQSAMEVSHSIKELSAIAIELQSNIAKFKT